MRPDHYNELCKAYTLQGRIYATTYRRGAMLEGWPSRWPRKPKGSTRSKRGIITSQSARSLIRAAFAIRAAEVDWAWMVTLTFRVAHQNPKECLRMWCRVVWPEGITTVGVCWVVEYQERGVVHYHVLMSEAALHTALRATPLQTRRVWRRGQHCTVLDGHAEGVMVWPWISAVADPDPGFRAFQFGGIVERLANPDSAHNYLANYFRKLAQKTLPDGAEPQGRWWWMSDVARPVPRGIAVVTTYPHDRPLRLVRDTDSLGLVYQEQAPDPSEGEK